MTLDHALAVAASGLPVFPCNAEKRPLVETGFKAATLDPLQIESWWQQWPEALIAVRTGAASGFFVIDLDGVAHGGPCGLVAWDKLTARHAVAATRRHETPNGGAHLLFRFDPTRPVTNRRGDLPAGIDVRGEGGYVIWPPSRMPDGRAWRVPETGETEAIADAPDWLYQLIAEKPAPPGAANGNGDGAYAEAALAGELAAVLGARRGQRNETLMGQEEAGLRSCDARRRRRGDVAHGPSADCGGGRGHSRLSRDQQGAGIRRGDAGPPS
jgi:hypothetical protein